MKVRIHLENNCIIETYGSKNYIILKYDLKIHREPINHEVILKHPTSL